LSYLFLFAGNCVCDCRFTGFLQTRGFTCGIEDLVITSHADTGRHGAIEKSLEEGVRAGAKFSHVTLPVSGQGSLTVRVRGVYFFPVLFLIPHPCFFFFPFLFFVLATV
jgi:hypothetical protein